MNDKERLLATINDIIDRGFRYLESKGWYRYEDGIVPPSDRPESPDDGAFRKALTSIEELRFELADGPNGAPF
jgi:hypothetical protein